MKRSGYLKLIPLMLAILLVLVSPAIQVGATSDLQAADTSKTAEIEKLFRRLDITMINERDPLEGQVSDLQGKKVNLSSFRGNVAFLTFWTTWCPSCRIEMPALQKLYARYRPRGFMVLAVSIQEPPGKVVDYFRSMSLSYTPLLDPKARMALSLGVWSVPSTFILDRKGFVLGKAVGSRHWESPDARKLLQLLLTE
ncbi:MAG: TlpA family protein disulfide reductase [Deltaproteobacteria bacterium]|nr:MAG: TlpA family protein disulfide reductase [Deltaproteobacteria bacterium]